MPKWLVEQNSCYSDYFNVISGFISNSRAPGGPVTLNFDGDADVYANTDDKCERTFTDLSSVLGNQYFIVTCAFVRASVESQNVVS